MHEQKHSQAIVIGWTLKLIWLFGTLLLDMLIATIGASRTHRPYSAA